jgi:hypothetical protein
MNSVPPSTFLRSWVNSRCGCRGERRDGTDRPVLADAVLVHVHRELLSDRYDRRRVAIDAVEHARTVKPSVFLGSASSRTHSPRSGASVAVALPHAPLGRVDLDLLSARGKVPAQRESEGLFRG